MVLIVVSAHADDATDQLARMPGMAGDVARQQLAAPPWRTTSETEARMAPLKMLDDLRAAGKLTPALEIQIRATSIAGRRSCPHTARHQFSAACPCNCGRRSIIPLLEMVISKAINLSGRVSVIWTQSFGCVVCTAKEGLFLPQSTIVSEARGADGFSDRRVVAKFIYKPHYSAAERLEFHDAAVNYIDDLGSDCDIDLLLILELLQEEWDINGFLEQSAVADE